MGWVETTPLAQDANVRSVEMGPYKFGYGCSMYCGSLSAFAPRTEQPFAKAMKPDAHCRCLASCQSESSNVPFLQ